MEPTGTRALIVDDNEEGCYLLETLLRGMGHEVISTRNGVEALRELRTRHFDIVITDILMPVMDGFQLCMQIKQDEQLRKIPLVFYTGAYTDGKDEELALAMGAQRFIQKPVSPDELMRVINDVLSQVHNGTVREAGELWQRKETLLQRYNERVVNKLEQKMRELEKEIDIRKKTEEELQRAHLELESRVKERTSELSNANQLLEEKIKTIDALYEHILQSREAKIIAEHTAMVAHELRQPLAVIGGFARRLGRAFSCGLGRDSREYVESLNIVVREVERLETILGELIDYVKPREIKPQRINPDSTIEYVLRINEDMIRAKNLRVHLKLCRDLTEIPVDPHRFEQVIRNLVANAVEASALDGDITISTALSSPGGFSQAMGHLGSETYFQVRVQNSGTPIAPEEIERIFNPFFTTKTKGVGLGLSLSKKIVADHGGSLSVQSGEGGTLFTVWLPLPEAVL